LVTLTGVGGVGKTHLATEVAARLADEFADGVWFFELAAVADPAAVPDAVAAVLGITQQPGRSVSESVADALEGRVRLLVFDNCEHVLDAAADLIEAILAQSGTVKILATSREGLGVGDEQVWPVPSLNVEGGADSAAVTLFVERAQGVAPRFAMIDADEAVAGVEICSRLDGIPLAIELAASRMASMTAGDVRDRLDHRFRLLVRSRRGLARHQTLRHAVAWSYDHLNDVADRSSGRTRYSMLETIRQFAGEQLVASGVASEARTAHARYFAGREEDVLALWDSPRQRAAYVWFSAELANLRSAFRWSADQGDLDVSATIANYAAWLGLWVENYEPIAWAEELIEPACAVDHPRLAALYVMASVCYMAGRIEAAVGYSDAGQMAMRSGRDGGRGPPSGCPS
jgi:predicted ATPase